MASVTTKSEPRYVVEVSGKELRMLEYAAGEVSPRSVMEALGLPLEETETYQDLYSVLHDYIQRVY